MKFFFFKIFLKFTARLAPYREVSHSLEQRLYCLEREREMQKCVRPRTDPTPVEGSRMRVSYTDYWERR